MHRFRSSFLCLITLSLFLGACGPNAQQLASTYIAQTMSAVTSTSPPTKTALPTDTQTPLPTDTSTPIPTDTQTVIPTDTPLPTHTPSITPTPGPFSYFDDFSIDSGGWEDCELCAWKDGSLVMGPFEPGRNLFKNYCTGCKVHTYYSLSVDATFIDGQVDRFFGVFAGDANGKQYYLGISPWQFYFIGQHTDKGDSWEMIDFQWSGVVNASYATNTFKITVQPAIQPKTADYLFSLNDTIVYIIYGIPVVPSKAGLAMDWHAVTVSYDNWQYVEIER